MARQVDTATEQSIPYEKPHDKRRQDHDTYRDQEEAEYEKARRKGNVLDLIKADAKRAQKEDATDRK